MSKNLVHLIKNSKGKLFIIQVFFQVKGLKFYYVRRIRSCTNFLKVETWKTLWILSKLRGKAIRLAKVPILSKISKGPTYLGLDFPFFPNLITVFIVKPWEIHDPQLGTPNSVFICLHNFSVAFEQSSIYL